MLNYNFINFIITIAQFYNQNVFLPLRMKFQIPIEYLFLIIKNLYKLSYVLFSIKV